VKSIFDISKSDRAELFTQAALKMGIGQPGIIEKDFWLVKTLQWLFSSDDFKKNHVFKGGTSLSKCFNLIQRFSEDVDITIAKSLLGFNEQDSEVAAFGNKRRKRYFDELSTATEKHVDVIASQLNKKLQSKSEEGAIYVDREDQQQVIFEYPKTFEKSIYPEDSYIRQRILLEFGCRGDVTPACDASVHSYAEEMFSNAFTSMFVTVNVLAPERTFWEKATLLHMLANQDSSKSLQPRMARHYYDVYKLSQSDVMKSAINNISLLETVAIHKSVYFKSRQASYETARPGTLKLIPSDALIQKIESDYSAMEEMFFGEVISFDDILEQLTIVENQINQL